MSYVPVIAVDGPGGSGKGIVCQHLAELRGFHILDSGALYRLVGLAARRAGHSLARGSIDDGELGRLAGSLDVSFEPTGDPESPLVARLAGEDVTAEIRTDEAGQDASAVASLPAVRQALRDLQRSFRRPPGLVADGRDMGTTIFPDADVKIFLTASAEARAQRRYNQLKHKGMDVSLHDLFQSIQARDERDTTRAASPLKPADDAFVVDSTDLGIDEMLARVDAIVGGKLGKTG